MMSAPWMKPSPCLNLNPKTHTLNPRTHTLNPKNHTLNPWHLLSLFLRSLANDVCTVDEAKSVYPFMAIGANIALVISGCYIRGVNQFLPAGSQLLGLRILVGTVLAMSVVMFAAKGYIDNAILKQQHAAAAAAAAAEGGGAGVGGKAGGKKKKSKGSFGESLAVLKNSPKIRNLALLVIGYGVGHR